MDIVRAEICDAVKIAEMAAEIWREHYSGIVGDAQVAYMLEKYQSADAISSQIQQGWLYYIMKEGIRDVGYIALVEQPADKAMFLSKYYVFKDFRGRGCGRACMNFIEDICRKSGLDTIWLTVNKHNQQTLKIYASLGFENAGPITTDIGGGFIMDDYKMVKRITPAK